MKNRATLITSAPQSPESQFRSRRRKYLLMMALRIVCLIAAAIVVAAKVPYALAWVGVCLAGMVLLPWAAVLVANDRPPRQASMMMRFWQRRGRQRAVQPPRQRSIGSD